MKVSLLLLLLHNSNLVTSQSKTDYELRHSINFLPSKFYNAYNATTPPVLHISPGDTVSTESIDAIGFYKDSVRKGERGNPLTGPFYIDGASPGNLLAIEIVSLPLNRSYATTLNAFILKILPKPQDKQMWRNYFRSGSPVRKQPL